MDAPSPFAPWEEWQRYFSDAELREPFRLKTVNKADAEGYSRLGCPAQRRGATIGCDLRGTTDLVISRGLPEVFVTPSAPLPDVCTKTALTISPYVTARSMDLEWGSSAWYDSFVRRRPRVEGANGILRNPTFAALAHMKVRVRGRAKVGLFAAFAARHHQPPGDRPVARRPRPHPDAERGHHRRVEVARQAPQPHAEPAAPGKAPPQGLSGATPGAVVAGDHQSQRRYQARTAGQPQRSTPQEPAEACPRKPTRPSRTPREGLSHARDRRTSSTMKLDERISG